ncbi:MAG: ribosome silencing factor [Chthoniobacterales bacterium]|nr:ribosome silencing factor [Chthoniobacterales bacterium]
MKKNHSTDLNPNTTISDEQLALCCIEAALDKKAEDPVILDLRGISTFTDYFVIVSGTSEPQIKAIANAIREKMREEHRTQPLSDDAYPSSPWIVIDYGSIIVHIFHERLRDLYDLESLWGDAKRLKV